MNLLLHLYLLFTVSSILFSLVYKSIAMIPQVIANKNLVILNEVCIVVAHRHCGPLKEESCIMLNIVILYLCISDIWYRIQ